MQRKKSIPKTIMIKIITIGNKFPRIGFGSVAKEDPPINRNTITSMITKKKRKLKPHPKCLRRVSNNE